MKTKFMNYRKLIQGILLLIVIALPFSATYTLLTYSLHTKLAQYTPKWSDEISYWHQAATFQTSGFNGGYYTVNEQEAPFSRIHFGCHGPIYPILFGYMGRFVGWKFYYAPIINIVLLTSAITWFIIKRKPNNLQLLFIGLLLLVFWPIHLYMITTMRLIIDMSLAIVLASFFCRVINAPDTLSWYYKIGFPLILLVLALNMPSWGFLFLPYFVLIRKQMNLTGFQATTLAVVSIAISFFLYSRIAAPYPLGFVYCMSATMQHSLLHGIKLFFWHMLNNIRLYFDPHHPSLWLGLRAQMLLAILAGLFFLRKKQNEGTTFREGIFVLMSCGLLGAGTICLYDVSDWRDFRVFAPFVFMAGLVFVEYKRFFLVALMLTGCLWSLPDFRYSYKIFASDAFPSDRNAIQSFTDEVTPILQYHLSDNAWDNTVLVHQNLLSNQVLLGIPPGIGISWFSNPEDLKVIKSKYLLINKTQAEIFQKQNVLTYIRTTSVGDLYINQRPQ